MRPHRLFTMMFGIMLLLATATAQNRSTGGIKGKVRVETGSPAGVSVLVRQGDREVTRAATDRNGDFSIQRLTPGIYGLTFRETVIICHYSTADTKLRRLFGIPQPKGVRWVGNWQ